MEFKTLKVKLVNSDSIAPKRAYPGDAGLDVFSDEDTDIYFGQRKAIKSGICIQVPKGYYCQVAPKSGLAIKSGIDVLGGIIDFGYTAEILVILINHSKETFHVKKGNKIAQLIMKKIAVPTIEIVENLEETDRGSNGFGSTGN